MDNLKLVTTIPLIKEELTLYHEKFLAEGYEGSMIRHGNDGYKVKGRSSSLLKYKDFLDGDFEVVDIVPFEKYPEQGKIFCKDNEGNGFYATPKMSHKDRESLLKNKAKYIGKIANIRYFEKTDEGVPRFPIFVGFHEDR